MANRYKIMFYDKYLKTKYPVIIIKDDICDLCDWLNKHTARFHLNVVDAQVIDFNDKVINQVSLLPVEMEYQLFITSLERRLIAHNETMNGGNCSELVLYKGNWTI